MQTSFKNITDTEQELTIIYPLDEYRAKLNEAYSSLQKKVKLDGFRPGKTPIHVIKKMYGESIEADELSRLASELIPEVLKENKLFVVSQPHLHKLEVTDDGVEIVSHYNIVPDFQLQDYKSLIVDEPVHRVSDEEIDEVIENFMYNSDNFETTETVEDQNYQVHIQRIKEEDNTENNFQEQSDDNGGLEDYSEFPIILRDKRYSPKFTSLLIGKKVGDEITYTPEHDHDHDHDHEHNHDHDHKPITFKIIKIEKINPNEINEEFIKKMTQDKFSTIEDWKEDIGFELQNNFDNESRRILEDNIIEKLIEVHDIKIPDFTILEQAQKMFEGDKKEKNNPNVSFDNPEIRNYYLNTAQKVIKWELIREKIIESENIEVEDYDIDGFIDNYNQYYQNFDKELLRKTILENKQILDTILVKKLMDLLIDFVTTNEIDMDKDTILNASLFGDFDDDDFEDEDEDIFDADEEYIDEEEFDDEFDEEFDEDDFEDDEEYDNDDDDDEDFDDDEDDD